MSEADHSTTETEDASLETDDSSKEEELPVNSDDTEEEKTDSEEEGDVTDEEEGEETPETQIDPQAKVFKVAGKEFKSLNEAISHVAKIAGDNSRLYGLVKSLSDQAEDFKSKYEEAMEANGSWQKYYEGKGDMPSQDLKRVVREIFEETKANQTQSELDKQYKTEWAEIRSKPGLSSVLPVMEDIVRRLGKDVKKISPTELYRMSLGLLNEKSPVASDIIRQTEERTIAKQKARKVLGGSKRAPSGSEEEGLELAPEVAQYVKGFQT